MLIKIESNSLLLAFRATVLGEVEGTITGLTNLRGSTQRVSGSFYPIRNEREQIRHVAWQLRCSPDCLRPCEGKVSIPGITQG